jgi:hypothetical protein
MCGTRKAICMQDGVESVSYTADDIVRETPKQEERERSEDGKVLAIRKPDGYTNVHIDASIPPGKVVDVTLVYVTMYENNYVDNGYFTKCPMVNAKLTANYPEEYEFDLFQALSSELEPTLKLANRTIHEAKGGILPHQGFVFSLKKKNAT